MKIIPSMGSYKNNTKIRSRLNQMFSNSKMGRWKRALHTASDFGFTIIRRIYGDTRGNYYLRGAST
jgi:hypothetical protein